jgi:CubicO group peptidase (beta-lactamase class C family)
MSNRSRFFLRTCFTFALATMGLSNVSFNPVHAQTTEEPRINLSQLEDSIDQVAQRCLKEQQLPGLSVIIVENGKTIFQGGYGFANLESKTKVDPETSVFRIGSISKALTFLTLTRLIDTGRLNRTDDVEKFIGPLTNPIGFESPVTIENLLTHTSGFDQIGTGRHIHELHLDLEQRKALRPSLVEFLTDNNLRRVNEPGEYFRYDTYGTTLAGAVIEKVTGKSFAEAMQSEMFQPLGMKASAVEVRDAQSAQLAMGYGWNENEYQPQAYEVYVTTPASSIDATPADMGRLMQALTSNGSNISGQFLTPAMTAKVLSPQYQPHPEFMGITHGLFEMNSAYFGDSDIDLRTVGHGGSMRGFRSAMTIVPERNLGIYIVTNRAPEAGGGNVNFDPIVNAILGQLPDAPQKSKEPIPPEMKIDLGEYVGDYFYGTYCHAPSAEDAAAGAWRRGRVNAVTEDAGSLLIRDQRFLPRGKDVFVQADGERKVFFGRNSKGDVTFYVYSSSPDTFEKAQDDAPYREFESLAQAFQNLLANEGIERALKFHAANEGSDSYYMSEAEFNRVGYGQLQSGNTKEAIAVFRLNAQTYTDSWNAFDSLGEAYAADNQIELAIRNYEKSIQLNPQNEAGQAVLDELKKRELPTPRETPEPTPKK